MALKNDIVRALKQFLKSQSITYKQLAQELSLSEAALKRSFAQENFSLSRLDEICKVLNIDYEMLLELSHAQGPKVSALTIKQEALLVSNHRLLLVAICVQNGWTLEEITAYYDMTEPECIKHLIALEREGLIRLLRNNRIRRLLSQDFRWLPNGPIQQFFSDHAEAEFLNTSFSGKRDVRAYVMGLLSPRSIEQIHQKLGSVMAEFEELQVKDLALPARQRRNTGLLVAFRAWELSVFSAYKREEKPSV
jgi:DNA-binding Xre family transcriptional regulator